MPKAKAQSAAEPDSLASYRRKRDFGVTTEPRGDAAAAQAGHSFVVQKHAASRLHYDFRLELGGVLVSWALPKGPSFDPADKRIAVHVEDHPLAYAGFEGTIPPKTYGAGTVIIWDSGTWQPIGDPVDGFANGKLVFELNGQKLRGRWELVKIAKPGDRQELWILFKKRGDAFARPRSQYDVLTALPDSVIARPLNGHAAIDRIAGARKAALPKTLGPQLATAAANAPAIGHWICEIKFDGYRIMARIEGGRVSLITRGGHDWSDRMPALVDELEGLGIESAWLDGEIVVIDEHGLPDFNRLQKAFDGRGKADIDYFLFDIPFFDGWDLRQVALIERRRLLKAMLDERETRRVRFSADFPGDPSTVLQGACRMKLEGVIVKRADSVYSSQRSESWLKLKCRLRQEFVIAGYTDRSDGSAQVGSLLLGMHGEGGELISVGSVGTGWDAAEAAHLKKVLTDIETDKSPFAAGAAKLGRWSKRTPGSERWVKPVLVAEVEFAAMTPDGQVRHATYVSLRSDKPAASVGREVRIAKPAAGIRISNANRVIDPSTGANKLDLVRYYESVAEFILPHLKGRPCSLVRGPTGIEGQLFFQKHAERTAIPGLRTMDASLWPGHDALLEVATPQALASAAQMNVIEFHTWNSTARRIDMPDRMIFDLDPGEGTPWAHVQEAAMLVRGFLGELGLECWLKTSGGKGLHLVVPLAPKLDYDTVARFSKAVVEHLARVVPSRFVAKSGAANRIGKLFVDYLRNGHGATTACAFSARARPGLGVSMPVEWDALPALKSGAQWTIATAREHLSFQTVDPWAGYWKCRQTLKVAADRLGFES